MKNSSRSLNNESKRTSPMVTHQRASDEAPDIRRFVRLLYVYKLWLVTSMLLALSGALVVHLFEKQNFISNVVLAFSSGEKVSLLSGVSGFQSSDYFLPKMNSLIEESRGADACKRLVDEMREMRIGQVGMQGLADESAICSSIRIVPDLEKMQVGLSVQAWHPALSKAIANVAARHLVELDKKQLDRKVLSLKRFLSVQESQLGKQLRLLEDERTRFQAETSVISVTQAEKTIYDGLEKSEQDYLDNEVKLKANENLIRQTQASIKEVTGALTVNDNKVSNLYLNQIQYRLTMLKYRRSMLAASDTSSEAKRIDSEIQSILQTYREVFQDGETKSQFNGDPLEYLQTLQASLKSLKKDNGQLKFQISALSTNLQEKSANIRSLAGSIQRLGEINREIDVTTSLYLVIKKRLQEVDIDIAASVSDLSILRRASGGVLENTPLLRKMLFALAIGLFVNIALLLVRDVFIPTIKDDIELDGLGITSVGYIPFVHVSPLVKMPVLMREYPRSIEADAFRALRLRLMSLGADIKKPNRALVVLVTSPLPQTGKTFVASNLAFALAKAGIKTLLVDLDLRHPSVSNFFETRGGADDLDRYFERDQVADCVRTEVENLDVISGGAVVDAPADKLENLFLHKFIENASTQYDVVLLDSPPVLSVIDSFLVAPYVGLNLLVVKYRKTHKDDILNSVRQLSVLQNIPTVAVINSVIPEMISGDGGTYYRALQKSDKAG